MANYRIFFGNRAAGAAPGAYTLPADAGSYALTGVITSLEFGRETAADPGTYALSGQTASLEYGREVLGASGSYSLTGAAATLTKAGAGATIFVGLTAGVTDGVIGSGGSLPTGWYLESGDVTLTVVGHGADDSVETFDLRIDAVHGAASPYVDINFPSYPGVTASVGQNWRAAAYRKIIASSGGSIAVSDFALVGATTGGSPVEVWHDATPPASSGAYQLSYLENNHVLANASTTRASGEMYFEIDASAADTSITLRLAANLELVGAGVTALPGSYGLSGTPASLEMGRKIPALVSSYALAGAATSLELGREVLATGGSYALSGTDTSLERGREVLGVSGSYALTGTAASLELGREVLAAGGSYALSGATATLIRAGRVTALGGSYTLSGLPINLLKSGAWAIIGLPGSYVVTGTAAALKLARTVIAAPGSYTLIGASAGLAIGGGEVIPPGSGQRDGDAVERKKKQRGKIFHIIIEAAKKVVERPMPLRKKRKRLAKLIAGEVLPEAGGLLAADKLLLELIIRRQLEQIPLTQMHTEDWYQLQDQLMQVITDAEQTAQRLRFESEEEDDLLLLLTS